ncbi:MAG: hypothetical protein ACYS8X_09645 [Planctomycetota bacterium]|jgi:hypothetical protein
MTKRELAALACKILALWVVYRGILWLSVSVLSVFYWIVEMCSSGFHYVPMSEWSGRYGVFSVLPGIVAIGFALLLWKKANSLAARMVADESAPPNLASADANSLLTVAIVVLGVVLIVLSLPVIVTTLIWPFFVREVPDAGSRWDSVYWHQSFWAPIVRITLGLWLVCGTRGIVRILARARTMGHKSGDNEAGSGSPSES